MRLILILFFIPGIALAQVPAPTPGKVIPGATPGDSPKSLSESQRLQQEVRLIVDLADSRDVTSRYQALEKYMMDNNIPNNKYGIDLEFLKGTAERSRRLLFERITKRIVKESKNGKIDLRAQDYREQAKNAGLSDSQINLFLSQQQEIAANVQKSCSPIDLRPELGPVRDQGSLGWCYAFAAADILSFKTKQRISAADIALTYNKNYFTDINRVFGANESAFQAGNPKSAIEKSTKKGLCLEKDFPSEDNYNSELRTNLDLIDKLRRGEQRSSALECKEVATAAKALFPNLDMSDIRKIALTTVNKDIVQEMANQTCKNRIASHFKAKSFFNEDKEKFMQNLDAVLDEKNPMVLGYDAGVLFDTESEPRIAYHASVIAGRRINEETGQCEYLIRNSSGRGCDAYDSKLFCQEGNIWIPRTDIQERSHSATYIK